MVASEFDPHGPIELKEVEEVFVRVAPIWNVHVAGRIIRTTAEHPFWVVGRGWIPATKAAHRRPRNHAQWAAGSN